MIPCPHCDRKPVATTGALFQHIKAKHSRQKARSFYGKHIKPDVDREDSYADEVVAALMATACGEEIAEHIELMFPDEIAEARRG